MNLLFIGDIVGRPGRAALQARLGDLCRHYEIDFTIANAENAAGGIGITEKTAADIFKAGADVITGGNHTWHKRDAIPFLEVEDRILRPANYPPGVPGRGYGLFETRGGIPVGVVNLQGRIFMQGIDCPFRVGSELVDRLRRDAMIVVVDIHAEATAEKLALGWHLARRATAVLGTHTHVPTADERILEGHTAYISDVGMTGPVDSVIGVRKELSIARFLTQIPQRFEVAGGDVELDAVVVDADEATGAAREIKRVVARY